ncbi:FAD/NAD(P)-binding protein [Patescibacteria group bacterium]|nr:FAD/NAD(P)-binding protein [Patescibacteria group bacterium]
MKNPYESYPATIAKIILDAPDTRGFTLQFQDKKRQAGFSFLPGQFIVVGLPGIGEIPVGINSSTSEKKFVQITVRGVGKVSRAIQQKTVGSTLFVRGPYGNGWPMKKIEKRDLLVIAGGLGIIPLKPLIDEACRKDWGHQNQVQVFYGSRNFKNLLFENQYKKWCQFHDTQIVLDAAGPRWHGEVGNITDLLDKHSVPKDAIVTACGPPIMYKFLIPKLLEKGYKEEDIYLSLERKMYCAVGTCEHCAIGDKYVCKDGPIFSLAEIKDMPEALE